MEWNIADRDRGREGSGGAARAGEAGEAGECARGESPARWALCTGGRGGGGRGGFVYV